MATIIVLVVLAVWCVVVTAIASLRHYRRWVADREWRDLVKRLDLHSDH